MNPKANKVQISRRSKALQCEGDGCPHGQRKGKPRARPHVGQTPNWKKAVVVLHPDYHIDLF